MIRKGNELMVFVGGKPLAYATGHSFEFSVEMKEVTHKDTAEGWAEFSPGLRSWKLTSDNLVGDGTATTKGWAYGENLVSVGTTVTVVFGIAARTAGQPAPTGGWTAANGACPNKFTGQAIVTSYKLNAPNGEDATATIELQGCSKLANVGDYTKAQKG